MHLNSSHTELVKDTGGGETKNQFAIYTPKSWFHSDLMVAVLHVTITVY